ncbi:MAG: DUF2267 domain-containing protein [Chthoniobacterales bacterium]|nr:DUF2267 domain-containing protein [Chthoniobacterales bacterium]
MNELINFIVQKTGMSQENAQKAARPPSTSSKVSYRRALAGQVDAMLSDDMSGLAGQASDVLKGTFGGFGS